MKPNLPFKPLALALSLAGLTMLAACSQNEDDTSVINGSILKGPIDGATVEIVDANGNVIGTSTSQNGVFTVPHEGMAQAELVYIRAKGGRYTDEATGETVNLGKGVLESVFTAEECLQLLENGEYAALTPETTLFAALVRDKLAAGTAPETALQEAKTIIEREWIGETNPTGGLVSGDALVRKGNLAAPLADTPEQALAKNRAISVSYLLQDLGLSPNRIIDLLQAASDDLSDGTLDGKKGDQALTLTRADGQILDLSQTNLGQRIASARQTLFQNTMNRLAQGDLSAAERQRLLGMIGDDDMASRLGAQLDALTQQRTEAEQKIQTLLAEDDLVALPRLIPLTDNDGDPTDNSATYILNVQPSVNVTLKLRHNNASLDVTVPLLRYNGGQLPPLIKAKRGQSITAQINNQLDEETTIHWHGFKIPADVDGGPDNPINAGESFSLTMSLNQPAASLWFHPHPHAKTGEQVYNGLAGIFILEDDITSQLEADNQLPAGGYDIPLLIQDRRFKDLNGDGTPDTMVYAESPRDIAMGMLGDRILVNGVEAPKLSVETRKYRFRLYNVSNARTYDFALHDGTEFWVVGTDGGLLPQPVKTDHITLAPAERAEIVIDFGNRQVGDKLMLVSQAFMGAQMGMMGGAMAGMNGGSAMDGGMMQGSGGMQGMGGGMMQNSGDMQNMGSGMGMMGDQPNGSYLPILRFDVATQVSDTVTLYTALPSTAEINTRWANDVTDQTTRRSFVMAMGGMDGMTGSPGSGGMMNGMSFTINGKAFDMTRVDETIITNGQAVTEVWEITNHSMMPHPFHAHAIQYQILDRNGRAPSCDDINTDAGRSACIDKGWKDTVLVYPGETVRLVGRFDPTVNQGKYMYHCHILEHEDNGMMGVFEVK